MLGISGQSSVLRGFSLRHRYLIAFFYDILIFDCLNVCIVYVGYFKAGYCGDFHCQIDI